MYIIKDGRATGKTYQLLEIANREHGVVICKNPEAMRVKAINFGFFNIKNFVSYFDSTTWYSGDNQIFLDEIEEYAKALVGRNLSGYTYTIEEE